ncbi:uncharacterized protein LAESUDRAFT_731864 [Laetiporus sulphureus 93-53]|uniref:Uncharacterized protein n=1 Tax=Laetiporus sulphureus 93-53 TaxID=1314785 RepID=A0A165BE18_9APHY|nr:uncharacterized protein LAESUDRAFT_731864 [Laetiporus sulphureus 93-53]KZT00845.1 hypothetical protein LAESUDRAFT_731864 [Laetiporus sulphureus 93-53]
MLFQAHVGFPDPSTRSGTYPEGHEKACARTELDKCEQRPFPRDPLPSSPRSPPSSRQSKCSIMKKKE